MAVILRRADEVLLCHPVAGAAVVSGRVGRPGSHCVGFAPLAWRCVEPAATRA